MNKKLGLVLLVSLCLGACATHKVKFHPLDGIAADKQAFMLRGEFDAPKEKVLDAIGDVLDHEPFFHWEYLQLAKADGWVKASAGLMREVNFRVVDAEPGRSRVAYSVPRRALRSRAKVWIAKKDASKATAYQPDDDGGYNLVQADFELDEEYFRSAIQRALSDRSSVPFEAIPHERDEALGEPPATQVPGLGDKDKP